LEFEEAANLYSFMKKAHKKGVTHVDLHRDNIFLISGQEKYEIGVIDFGMSNRMMTTEKALWENYESLIQDASKNVLNRNTSPREFMEAIDTSRVIAHYMEGPEFGPNQDAPRMIHRAFNNFISSDLNKKQLQEATEYMFEAKTMADDVFEEYISLKSNKAINAISGIDDAYNTIEGLHPGGSGLGTQNIKMNTDFGSGWIRNLFGNAFKAIKGLFSGIFKTPNKSIVGDLLSKENIKVASTIEEYVSAVAGKGVSKEIIQKQAEAMRLSGPLSFVKGRMVYAGEEKVFGYSVLKDTGVKFGSKAYKRKVGVLKDISLFHEISEVKYGTYAQKAFGDAPEIVSNLKFGSHWSQQVIKREAEYAKSLGKEGIEIAGLLRKTENINITQPISRQKISETVKKLREVRTQVRRSPTPELLQRKEVLKAEYYKQKTARIYQEVLGEDIVRKTKRMKLFRETSYNSVGIGLRNAKNAGKGHCKFTSTQR